MELTFLGTTSGGGQCPTLYATDQGSYIVQGWIVTDATILVRLRIPDDETCVEVPAHLLAFLERDGIRGKVTTISPPIMHVTERGTYIIQGKRVHDPQALSSMEIPETESCIEVARTTIADLVRAG